MTLRITHLGTGSRGNSTLLETDEVKVLIDQGFSGAQLEKRLRLLGISPEEIDCALISHHHGDHGGGASIAQKKWKIGDWISISEVSDYMETFNAHHLVLMVDSCYTGSSFKGSSTSDFEASTYNKFKILAQKLYRHHKFLNS